MPIISLEPRSIDSLTSEKTDQNRPWVWDGYLCPGDVTLLTSLWKTGKTTLLTGLLQHLAGDQPFLGRSVVPARALVVSEESASQWAERIHTMPLGSHVQLLPRPFLGRPTMGEWQMLIDRAIDLRAAGNLDLFVVDPLASFLPGRCESDASSLIEALQPLHKLAATGVAILLLHHPRKDAAVEGSIARGSGALLGFVDTSLELRRYSILKSDRNLRMLLGQSRRAKTPARLAYEWNPTTGAFTNILDASGRQFEENWPTILGILQVRHAAITQKEVMSCWPTDAQRPCATTLYYWLCHAFELKRIRREGAGSSRSPWLYRLETANDAYFDRGELPPLRWK